MPTTIRKFSVPIPMNDLVKAPTYGIYHPMVKLTNQRVEDLLTLFAENDAIPPSIDGDLVTDICRDWGVSDTTIRQILDGTNWRHIRPDIERRPHLHIVKTRRSTPPTAPSPQAGESGVWVPEPLLDLLVTRWGYTIPELRAALATGLRPKTEEGWCSLLTAVRDSHR